jgi:hypothetical protein
MRYTFKEFINFTNEYICQSITLRQGVQWNCDENQNVVGVYKTNGGIDIQKYGKYIEEQLLQQYARMVEQDFLEQNTYYFGVRGNKFYDPAQFEEEFNQKLNSYRLKKGVRRVVDDCLVGITQDPNSRFNIVGYGKYLERKLYKEINNTV